MSKPIPKDDIPRVATEERLRAFAAPFSGAVGADARVRFAARCDSLGFRFGADKLTVLAGLDTPERVQEFLNAELYYNDDHASVDQEETTMPPCRSSRSRASPGLR